MANTKLTGEEAFSLLRECEPKKIKVRLIGTDGNAFALLGKCIASGRRGGMSSETLAQFTKEAMAGDYDHLLATCDKYFDVT